MTQTTARAVPIALTVLKEEAPLPLTVVVEADALGEPAVGAVPLLAIVEVTMPLLPTAPVPTDADPVAVAVEVTVKEVLLPAPAPPLPPWVGVSPASPVGVATVTVLEVAELLSEEETRLALSVEPEEVDDVLTEATVTPSQLKSNCGVNLRSPLVTPKLGLGVVG